MRPGAVVIVILRGDRLLVIRRGDGGPDPGVWSPPAGKIEVGETEPDAVVREAHEELGLPVRPLQRLGECVSSGGTHTLHWWLAEPLSLDLRPDADAVREIRWVTREELSVLEPLFPGDLQFIGAALPPHGGR